jgi:hypothetical protein
MSDCVPKGTPTLGILILGHVAAAAPAEQDVASRKLVTSVNIMFTDRSLLLQWLQ